MKRNRGEIPQSDRDSSSAVTLRKRPRMLQMIWLGWLAIASVTLGVFIAAAPLRYTQLLTACAGTSCGATAAYLVALDAFTSLVWFSLAVIVFWRRPGDRIGIFTSLTLLTFGVARFPDTPLALAAAYPGWWLPVEALRFIGSACLSVFFFVFPDGHFVPRATRWLAAAWVLIQVPQFFFTSTGASSNSWPPLLRFAGFLGFVLAVFTAQAWRYRRISTPTQRQQTRLVVLGLTVALICYLTLSFGYPLMATIGIADLALSPVALTSLTSLTFLLVPITLAVAILRYRLYDVDSIINQALVYGALTAALALLYIVSVYSLQALATAITAQRSVSPVALVISTLVITSLFQPLRRAIQREIDRRFYRRKYDANATALAFASSLRHETDLTEICDQLLTVSIETMQPAHASIWLRSHTRHDPGALS